MDSVRWNWKQIEALQTFHSHRRHAIVPHLKGKVFFESVYYGMACNISIVPKKIYSWLNFWNFLLLFCDLNKNMHVSVINLLEKTFFCSSFCIYVFSSNQVYPQNDDQLQLRNQDENSLFIYSFQNKCLPLWKIEIQMAKGIWISISPSENI